MRGVANSRFSEEAPCRKSRRAEEMAAFDELPLPVRRFLTIAPGRLSAVTALEWIAAGHSSEYVINGGKKTCLREFGCEVGPCSP